MKKNFILRLLLLVVISISIYSCRSEDIFQENEHQKQDLRASVLRFHEISNNTALLKKVNQLQSGLFSSNAILGKNNSVLDGATISTDKVILVENGTQKTYTFPVKRNSESKGLENLVLKENSDSSFSGVLIQYDITPLEKDLFVLGEEVDMKNKIKAYEINDLNISQKIVTEAFGCFVITWENGICGSGQHGYGDDSCQLTGSGAAPAPGIISIVNTCSGGAGGENTGIPNYPNPNSPGGNTGGYNTLPYSDDSDMMLLKYQQFSSIFHISTYGLQTALRTKLFYLYLYQNEDEYIVSELLSFFGTKPEILNGAVDLFTENASLTWEQFYNQFLTNPCEKTKSVLSKPNVQSGINNVKAQALSTLNNINAGEIGFKEKKDGTIVPANVSAAHHVIFNDVTDSYGGYHNHTALGTHMFSPPDIDALFGFAAAQSIQDGVGNAYLGMIAVEWCNCPPSNQQFLNYLITYIGTGAELGGYTYTTAQMNQFIIDYQKVVSNLTNKSKSGTAYIKNSGDLNEKGLEKLFFETLKIMNLSGKVNLQRIEPNGNIYNVNLDINGIPVGTPCP